MYRVYYKEQGSIEKWKLLAAFMYLEDAAWFITDSTNSDPEGTMSYKIMQGSKNIRKYNV